MHVLVAMEPRLHREAIGGAIQMLRPHHEVTIVEPGVLTPKLARVIPDVVVCDRPDSLASVGDRHAWIELSDTPRQPTRICLCGRRSKLYNPRLGELLSVVDETERLAQRDAV